MSAVSEVSSSSEMRTAAARHRAALRRWTLLAIALGTLGVAASELLGGVWPVTLVTPLARQLAAMLALGAIGLLILRFAWRGPPRRHDHRWLVAAIVIGVYATLAALGAVPWRDVPKLALVTADDADLGTLKVLSANVHSSNTDHASLLKLIADERPDVVLLMEVNSAWLRSLKSLDAEYPVRERVADDFGHEKGSGIFDCGCYAWSIACPHGPIPPRR